MEKLAFPGEQVEASQDDDQKPDLDHAMSDTGR